MKHEAQRALVFGAIRHEDVGKSGWMDVFERMRQR